MFSWMHQFHIVLPGHWINRPLDKACLGRVLIPLSIDPLQNPSSIFQLLKNIKTRSNMTHVQCRKQAFNTSASSQYQYNKSGYRERLKNAEDQGASFSPHSVLLAPPYFRGPSDLTAFGVQLWVSGSVPFSSLWCSPNFNSSTLTVLHSNYIQRLSRSHLQNSSFNINQHHSALVGGFNPSEKYWSIGMIIPYIWKNKECSKPPTSQLIFLRE